MNRHSWRIVLAALAVVLLCGSCSFRPRPAPEVAIINAQFTDVNLLETGLEFTLRLSNNTPQPLEFDGSVHEIWINGSNIGSGSNGDRLSIPRFGSVTQKIHISLSNLSMLSKIHAIVDSEHFEYRIKSSFYQPNMGIFYRAAHVEKQGEFDFPQDNEGPAGESGF
jgi:LEA14-like dessication related protein